MTRTYARVDDPDRLTHGQIAIARGRLDELLAKERAHDDYVVATRLMSQRVRGFAHSNLSDEWYSGYQDGLRDFARLIVDQASLREDM